MKLNKLFGAAAAVLFAFVCAGQAFAENAFMLYESGSLWLENANGEMEYKASVEAGHMFTVYAGTQKDALRISKTAGNATRNFVKVKDDDGKDYWVQTSMVAIGNYTPAFLLEDAAVYSTTDLINPNGTVLDKHTVVCFAKEETGSSYFPVSRIAYYDSRITGTVVEGYVLSSKVLSGANNLKIFRALNDVLKSSDKRAQAELFSNIQLMNPAPELAPMIEEVRNSIDGSDLTYGGIEYFMFADYEFPPVFVVVADSSVNMRNLPGSRGDIIGSIESFMTADTEVTVLSRTVLTETYEGVTDHWYNVRTSEGKTGWIFGAYLHLSSFESSRF